MMNKIINVGLVAAITMVSVVLMVMVYNEIVDYAQYQQVLQMKKAIIAL